VRVEQVGCTLNCTFCHTGTQRLVRNLTAGEIVGQVLAARDSLGDWPGGTRPTDGVVPSGDRCITNIVMMGMGEPLYNFDAVRDALLIVADGEGIGISKRRITLSTSGVIPNIERTGAEIGCMLAVSLHAVRDDLRNELVPLNRKYPISELLDACRNYPGVSNAKRITFEYVMLKGVNDSTDDAKALIRLLKGIPPRSISFHSIRGPAANTSVPTGSRSKDFHRLCSMRDMLRRCERRAGATSWQPAVSSRARQKNFRRASVWPCARWQWWSDNGVFGGNTARCHSSAGSLSLFLDFSLLSLLPVSRLPSASLRRTGQEPIPTHLSA
jgi:adenine C2-methylase RlmN of 23S rRNA A2503 and tRNA A37